MRDEKVVAFPTLKDEDEIELVINKANQYSKCCHTNFVVDVREKEVCCAKCDEKLNPMWVLEQLAGRESRLARQTYAMRAEVRALAKRRRFTCGACSAVNDITKPVAFRATPK